MNEHKDLEKFILMRLPETIFLKTLARILNLKLFSSEEIISVPFLGSISESTYIIYKIISLEVTHLNAV